MQEESVPDLPQIAQRLNLAGAKYVLVGGLAVVLQGSPRFTDDVDFALAFNLENVRAVVEALRPFNPRPQRLAEGAAWEWDEKCIRGPWTIWRTDVGRVDLIVRLPGVEGGFQGVYDRAILFEVEGVVVPVASIEDLISMKSNSEREIDRHDVMRLRAIQAELIEADRSDTSAS